MLKNDEVNRNNKLTGVKLLVVKVGKEVGDSGISTIVKLSTDFFAFISSNCFDINQDWIINGRSVIVKNRNGMREFVNYCKLIR